MILVWRGWGIAVPFIAIISQLVTELACDIFSGDPAFHQTHGGVWTIGLSVAAALVWTLGSWLDAKPGRMIVDPATNKKYELKARHDLFWIPLKWWAVPLVVLGAFIATH